MRKHILTRLKTLLSAACATLYTRQLRTLPLTFSLEPEPNDFEAAGDAWLFDADAKLEATRIELSDEMNAIADGLSDLRETLAFIHGETPFPVEATTLAPCAIVHHDDVLFDGEAEAPFIPAQEEISGGEGVYLFGDEPTFQEEQSIQQQAA